MFTTFVTVALFSTFATQAVLAQDAFTISTPQINQCQDVHITWSGGKAPYNLIIVPSDDPCESVLVELGDHQGTSMTWKNILPAGTKAMLSLQDANENEAWSGVITVGGGDTSCYASSSVVSSSAASSSIASPSAVSASDSALSANSAGPTVVTALTIPATINTAAPTTSSQGAAVPVGAANAGINPLGSGSAPVAKLSISALAVTALTAVFMAAF